MTKHDFFLSECDTWGWDEVERLLNLGYAIIPANNRWGWTWLAPDGARPSLIELTAIA